MKNKSLVWGLTIALLLLCLYHLSFSLVTSGVEKDAKNYAVSEAAMYRDTIINVGTKAFDLSTESGISAYELHLEEDYLRNNANKPAYPILGHSYQFCKDNEITLGLDLQGGMSVALEVSIPELIDNMAGNPRQPSFRKAYDAALQAYKEGADQDFITIFEKKVNELSPDLKLAPRFYPNNKEKFGSADISNDEVFAILRKESNKAIDNTQKIIESRINAFGVNQPTIQKQSSTGRLLIDLPGVKDKERARKLLQSTARLEFWHTYKNTQMGNRVYETTNKLLSDRMYPGYRDSIEKAKADTNSSVSKDSTGIASDSTKVDSTVDFSAGDEVATTETSSQEEELEKYKKLSPLSAYLFPYANQEGNWVEGDIIGYAKLSDTGVINSYFAKDYVKAALPNDLVFMWDSKPTEGQNESIINLHMIKLTKTGEPLLDGESVTNARQDFNQVNNQVEVLVQFNTGGASAWGDMTEQSANDKTGIAITLDNKVFSAPIANGRIDGGSTSITGGSFSGENGIQEAQDLASILRAGALPAPAKIVDESIVGPTLGAENIRKGLFSFAFALLLVLIYMFFYYSKAGAVADIALMINIILIFGILASLGAALTLPGIAGIVLTIGMSVDANVIIFERIREELRLGKGLKGAIKEGYSKAYSAIFDANITTLLTAAVLAYFGSGPIQGFATTLIIGIFTSLFSAILITRLIIDQMLDKDKEVTFSTPATQNWFVNSKIDFLGKRKIFYAISGLIIAIGIGSLVTRGLDAGVEFTGGRTFTVEFSEQAPDFNKMKQSLGAVFVENGRNLEPEVKMIDNKNKAKITTKYLVNDKTPEGTSKVEAKLREGLATFGAFQISEQRQVDSTISKDLFESSIYAIVFSLIIIFLYIVIRFQKWQFGFGALVAMFHDVLIVLSLFSIFYGVLPFSMEIDQAFIAAILTVVGYSINDTVIIFDRIRETLTDRRRDNSSDVINDALNQTLSRTMNTSMTTFVVIFIIFLFGGSSISGFAFALLMGVFVGTYSSLCIAAPLVSDLSRSFDFAKKQKL